MATQQTNPALHEHGCHSPGADIICDITSGQFHSLYKAERTKEVKDVKQFRGRSLTCWRHTLVWRILLLFFFQGLNHRIRKSFFFSSHSLNLQLCPIRPHTRQQPARKHCHYQWQQAVGKSDLAPFFFFFGASKQTQGLRSATATANERRSPAAVAGCVGVPATAQERLPDSTPILYVAIR